MERRRLGSSGLEVSALGLGSWQTYERLPREAGLAVMRAAREHGIDFLDDARYDDRTGTAPIPTGYSEVVFGELFRAAGWPRDEVVVANKLWWEFWPEQSAAEELDGSLGRMGFEYLDLVYSAEPPDGLSVAEVVDAVADLIASGKLRAWGILNWSPELVEETVRLTAAGVAPTPCAAQLPYNLALREVVEGAPMQAALEAGGIAVVASWVLAGGALSGKYDDPDATGRIPGGRDNERYGDAFEAARELRPLAAELGTTPAALAVAFALSNPAVSSVLFGATTPAQVAENASALELLDRLGADGLARLHAVGA